MTSSANSLLAGAVLLAAWVGVPPALAQGESAPDAPKAGAPRNIKPAPYLDPETILPAAEEAGEAATPGEEEFESSELAPLESGAIGTLSEARAGYPVTLWQGSRPGRVLSLLGGMPGGTRFPAANAMERKVLLSAAALPADETVAYSLEPYLYARLERLNAMGDLDSLLYLFEQIPRQERSPRLARHMVDAYLLDGDFETACALAEEGQREDGAAAWLKIAAVCHALKKDENAARLRLALLQEEGEADPSFANLLEDVIARVAGTPSPLNADAASPVVPSFFERSPYLASELTALHVALLKLFGSGADVDLSSGAPSNLMLAALVRWGTLPLETKMKVADLALERGVLDQEFLSELASAYRFTPADKASPYLLDYQTLGLKGDALFYTLSLEARDPSDAVRFLREGWLRARAGARAAFLAPLYQKALRRIPADSARIAFAPDAVRIYLLSGDFIRALGWYNVALDAAAAGDPEAARILVEAWPLMVVLDADGAIPFSSDILDLWNQSLSLLPDTERFKRRAYFMDVVAALGIGSAPSAAMEDAVEPPPASPLLGSSLGETVLQCLAALGREGPGPSELKDVLTALSAAGLKREARALALEILLAQGF